MSKSDEPKPPQFRLDRTAFSVGWVADQDDDGAYWQTKTPLERLAATEYLRRMAYGPAASARLQRVLSFAQLGED
ncbi:MAG: hypothetical protein AABZ53_15500 [Planctomycetota bacterium]